MQPPSALTNILLAILLTGLSLPSHARTLKESIELALSNHPELQIAAANQRAATMEINQAKTAYAPTIDLRLGVGSENSENASTQGNRTLTRQEASITLRQKIYDGNQTQKEIAQTQAKADSLQSRLNETQLSVALRTIEAHLEVIRNEELVKLTQENLSNHQDLLQKMTLRLNSGVGQKSDLQQTEGRLALANSLFIRRKADLQDANTKYLRIVGKAPNSLTRPDNKLDYFPASFNEAKETALTHNPLLTTAAFDIAAAKSATDGARAKTRPQLDFELGVNRNRNLDGVAGPNHDVIAMLVMRYNLFRGGLDNARVQEFTERETVALETQHNLALTLEKEIADAWTQLIASRDSLTYLEQHVKSSTQVLEAYRAQFNLGRRTLLDLLNAENELLQAKSAWISGQYSLLIAQYRVLASTGKLLSTLKISAQP